MSTERRGMSRTKRLMAVPPFRAKQVSFATSGIVRTSSAAWRRYCSDAAIEVLRHGDVVFCVQLAAAHEHALAFAMVDAGVVELLQPSVIVAVREPEEQPLHSYVSAIGEKPLKPARAEIAQPLHEHIRLMEGLALWNLIQQFEDSPFRRR